MTTPSRATPGPDGFSGRVTVLGFGTIGRCLLPMLRNELDLATSAFTVVDAVDPQPALKSAGVADVRSVTLHVRPDTMGEALEPWVAAGDLLVNLTVGVDSVALADWCQRRGALYVDSSIEIWEQDAFNCDISAAAPSGWK